MKLRRGLLSGIAGLATVATLALAPAAAFAAGPGGGGRGGGGGGTGETTTTNNLSVPTIMVGGGFTGVICPADTPAALVTPSGAPSTNYPIDSDAYYYVQGLNTWQAQCYTATAASATAAWGDNLTGSAVLRPGYPIRVELGLFNDGKSPSTVTSMNGYNVVKLDPNALDRESAYGVLAESSTGPATVTPFGPTAWRVYDAGVTFSVKSDTGAYVVPENTAATAEINATGNVVYGYNLRVSTAGSYTITFNIPTVTITGTDAGSSTDHSVTLTINVGTGGGGGGGGGGGHHGGR